MLTLAVTLAALFLSEVGGAVILRLMGFDPAGKGSPLAVPSVAVLLGVLLGMFISLKQDQMDTLRPLISLWCDIAANGILSLPPSRERRIWIVLRSVEPETAKWKDNYYLVGEGPSGWWGKTADSLGLQGRVERDEFEEILQGHLPDGTEFRQGHRPGTDLTFSAPKSVSLMGLVEGDLRILKAPLCASPGPGGEGGHDV